MLNSQTEGLMITLSTTHALGLITENNTLTHKVRLNASLTPERKYGQDWFILLAGTSITYPGTYTFPPLLSLCSCKQNAGSSSNQSRGTVAGGSTAGGF